MIVTVGNIKGGVGKSTLACNIAVMLALAQQAQKRDVLLIDGDIQSSATAFTDERAVTLGDDQIGYTCVSIRGPAIRTQMRDLAAKYADIVIDCGGQNNPSLRAALTVCDRLIVPLAPRSIDAWALESMLELVSEVRDTINPDLQTFILINRADAQGSDNEAVKELVRSQYLAERDAGIEIMGPVIVNRKPFADAFGAGLSVVEHRPRDAKAIDELIALMAIVYKTDRKDIHNGYTGAQQRRIA